MFLEYETKGINLLQETRTKETKTKGDNLFQEQEQRKKKKSILVNLWFYKFFSKFEQILQ